MTTKKIELRNFEETRAILGERDEFLQLLYEKFNCRIISRGNFIELYGDDLEVEHAEQVIKELKKLHRAGNIITMNDVAAAVKLVKDNRADEVEPCRGERFRPHGLIDMSEYEKTECCQCQTAHQRRQE